MRRLLGGGEVPSSQLFLVHFPSFLRQLDRMVSLFGVRSALQSCCTSHPAHQIRSGREGQKINKK